MGLLQAVIINYFCRLFWINKLYWIEYWIRDTKKSTIRYCGEFGGLIQMSKKHVGLIDYRKQAFIAWIPSGLLPFQTIWTIWHWNGIEWRKTFRTDCWNHMKHTARQSRSWRKERLNFHRKYHSIINEKTVNIPRIVKINENSHEPLKQNNILKVRSKPSE